MHCESTILEMPGERSPLIYNKTTIRPLRCGFLSASFEWPAGEEGSTGSSGALGWIKLSVVLKLEDLLDAELYCGGIKA